MSTESVGAEGKLNAIQYVNLKINKKDWCSFKGKCDIDSVIFSDDLCYHCNYHNRLSIPELINQKKKERYKCRE